MLSREPDFTGIPNNRFNKRLIIQIGENHVLVRSKRRGDVDVSIIEETTGKAFFVYRNSVDHSNKFLPDEVENLVLPALRRRMVLDDLADV